MVDDPLRDTQLVHGVTSVSRFSGAWRPASQFYHAGRMIERRSGTWSGPPRPFS
jgi:hypothetical protein